MDQELKNLFAQTMFDTCRDQMEEVKNHNSADAGEKMRQCFTKYYKLIMHQNDYYNRLTKNQMDDILNR